MPTPVPSLPRERDTPPRARFRPGVGACSVPFCTTFPPVLKYPHRPILDSKMSGFGGGRRGVSLFATSPPGARYRRRRLRGRSHPADRGACTQNKQAISTHLTGIFLATLRIDLQPSAHRASAPTDRGQACADLKNSRIGVPSHAEPAGSHRRRSVRRTRRGRVLGRVGPGTCSRAGALALTLSDRRSTPQLNGSFSGSDGCRGGRFRPGPSSALGYPA